MPMRTRIDYARVVASLASEDNDVDDGEIESIRGLCGALGLPPAATEGVLLFAREPNPDRVRESLDVLRDTDLALTLVTDLVALAMSDGKYHINERRRIHALAAMLLVQEQQISKIEDYIAGNLEGSDMITNVDQALSPAAASTAHAGEAAAGLVAACVPLAAVWAMSPSGVSMSGVTFALDRMGFGLGPLFGVAVDVTLGLTAYLVVRITYDLLVVRAPE